MRAFLAVGAAVSCLLACPEGGPADAGRIIPGVFPREGEGEREDPDDEDAGPAWEGDGEGEREGEGEGEGDGEPGAVGPVQLSELDCHGRQHIELEAAPGTTLGGLSLVVDDGAPSPFPASTVPTGGRLLLSEDEMALGLPCFEGRVRLVRGAEIVDEVMLPAFPGSFRGTTWCRLSSLPPLPSGALCTPTPGAPNAAWVDPEPLLFNPLEPATIDLDVAQADLDLLAASPREYVPAAFTLTSGGAVIGPIVVGVALKGNAMGSFRSLARKAAFKIRFDKIVDDQRFLGLNGLKLGNMVEDASHTHEVTGYAVFRAVGVPAPRAGYAVVRMNGESYGLHVAVERVDATWASRHFRSTRHIYEAGILGLDVDADRIDELEVEAGDETDLADVVALAAVGAAADGAFLQALQARTRLAAAARSWIASQYLAHWDGYAGGTNNYYLHSDEDGAFTFVPSGIDQSLMVTPYPLKSGQSEYAPQGRLYNRCRGIPGCDDVLDAEATAIAAALEAFDVVGLFDNVVEAITPALQADPRLEVTAAEIAAAQAATRELLLARPSVLP